MVKVEYPPYEPRIKTGSNTELIFDELRKQWIVLTPEEWVRQNFLQYLVRQRQYPAALIAIEKEITLHDVKKRFDIVVYDRATKPWMVVECKEMNVPLTEGVLHQALRYNIALQVKHIVITNGSHCHAFENVEGELVERDVLPDFL